MLNIFLEQIREYVDHEAIHMYCEEVEMEIDNYGSELTVTLNNEEYDINYIDLDMYIREALPEYFNENPIKGD
jgi:hypothetical protein